MAAGEKMGWREEERDWGGVWWCLPPDIEEAELRPDEHLGGYAVEPEPPHLHLEGDLSMSICFRESWIWSRRSWIFHLTPARATVSTVEVAAPPRTEELATPG
jgi:hypothetical protein